MICDCGGGGEERRKVGWIETRRGLHSFHVTMRHGQVDVSTLAVDDDLLELLGGVKSKRWFVDRLCGDAENLALVLQKVATELLEQSEAAAAGSSIHLSSSSSSSIGGGVWARSQVLVRHLEQLGWNHVVGVNAELTLLRLRCWDEAKREHAFEVAIPSGYPLQSPTVQASLPAPIAVPWPHHGQGGDLKLVLNTLQRELSRLQGFFAVLDDIDGHCWVLDPVQPSYAITTRRIAVERTCSVVVDVSPAEPRALCEVRFLGPPNVVQPMQSTLGQRVGAWQAQRLLRENLEDVLGVALPLRSAQAQGEGESFLLECGICYSYTHTHDAGAGGSSNSIPDQACPNAKCGRVYHNSCLVDWLQSVPSSRSSFGTVFGSCPYCGEWLSTKSLGGFM